MEGNQVYLLAVREHLTRNIIAVLARKEIAEGQPVTFQSGSNQHFGSVIAVCPFAEGGAMHQWIEKVDGHSVLMDAEVKGPEK